MKEIPLSRGKVALVDDDDYEWLNQWKWCYLAKGYAIRAEGNGAQRRYIYMHRLILNPSPGLTVDHINRNRLDNRRENLRVATYSQQMFNLPIRRDNKSGYYGVSKRTDTGRWTAHITHNHHAVSLGTFDDPASAARAYDAAAVKHRGAFANLNFPDSDSKDR